MDSTTQDRLYEHFLRASGRGHSTGHAGTDLASTIAYAVNQVVSKQRAGGGSKMSAAAPRSSSSHQVSGTAASTTSGDGAAHSVASIATTALESGLGVVSLVKGLFGLFGGGGSPAPPPLVRYAMPERLYFEGADTAGVAPADYDQMGMPRSIVPAGFPGVLGDSGQASSSSTPQNFGSSAAQSAQPQQITVNIQAMDSRSFLDHSDEIAQAVRQAMLTLSPINDVVSEL